MIPISRGTLMTTRFLLALPVALLLGACSRGSEQADAPAATAAQPAAGGATLTAFQLEHGIGPVTEAVTLGALDPAMAARGKAMFEAKCSACHKFDARYVGPSLGGVLERRTPAYVMNMILAPEEMYTKHPAARQLLAEHMTQMPNAGLTRDQAREVVEYFRTVSPTPSGQ